MILRIVFDRVTVHVSDLAASRAFYELLVGPDWNEFTLAAGPPPTRHLHVAFVTRSRAEVDERWQRAIDAGYTGDGEPGVRPEYGPDYYGGFLRDPDGNSAEVVYHGREREGAFRIDHLSIGVADLGAAKGYWSSVASELGLRIANEQPTRFHVAAGDRSFAVVCDGRPPTEQLRLTFPDGTLVALAD